MMDLILYDLVHGIVPWSNTMGGARLNYRQYIVIRRILCRFVDIGDRNSPTAEDWRKWHNELLLTKVGIADVTFIQSMIGIKDLRL